MSVWTRPSRIPATKAPCTLPKPPPLFDLGDDRVGIDGQTDVFQLIDLALANEPRVIGCVAALHHARHDVGATRASDCAKSPIPATTSAPDPSASRLMSS